MSHTMILRGTSGTTPRVGMVQMGPGMEFLPGVIIDQHFAERGRLGRLLSAVAQYPHHLGVGIDENTALIDHQHRFRVIGEGAAAVIDAGQMTYTNVSRLKSGDPFALCGVVLHTIPSGYCFDLHHRKPQTAGERDQDTKI